jgi:hypothetical protein
MIFLLLDSRGRVILMKKILKTGLIGLVLIFASQMAWAFECDEKPNNKLCKEINKYVSRVQRAAENEIVGPIRLARIDKAYADMQLATAEHILCMETENVLERRIDALANTAKGAVRVDAASFARMYRAGQRLLGMCY